MGYTKKVTADAAAQLHLLPPETKRLLRGLVDELSRNPYIGKPLQGELDGFWSARHQRYRVIYSLDEKKKQIAISYIGKRTDVYEKFQALIELSKKSRL